MERFWPIERAAIKRGLDRVKPWLLWLVIFLIIAVVSSLHSGCDWIIPDTIIGWSFALVWGAMIVAVLIYCFLAGVDSYQGENQGM